MLILPAILIPLKDYFGVSITQITLLGTICYFLYGVMALPGGLLADKLGYKIVLAIFFLGTPVAACIVGASRSIVGLGIGQALLGLFASLYHPSGLAMISHGVRARGKALGFHGMSGNLGLAFSPIVAGSIALQFSWRYAYYLLSVPGFIAAAVFLLVSRTALDDNKARANSPESSVQNTPAQSSQRLSIPAIILLYTAMMLTGFCYRGVVTMLPTYLGRTSIDPGLQKDMENGTVSESLRKSFAEHKTQLSQAATVSAKAPGRKWQITDENKKYTVIREKNTLNVYGRRTAGGVFFATMVYLVGMLGQYMGGHFSDKYRKIRFYLLLNALSLPLMILIGLTPGMAVVGLAAFFALFHFASQPVENNLIAHYTPARLRSSGYGLKFFLTFGIGSFASAFSGFVVDNFGFNSVFLALGFVIAVMVVLAIILNLVAKEEKVPA